MLSTPRVSIRRSRLPVLTGWALLALGACGGGALAPSSSHLAGEHKAAPSNVAGSSASCVAKSTFKRAGESDTSSSVLAGRIGARRVALVADEDAKAILTLDLTTQTEIARTELGATPGQLVATDDGRVYVSLRDRGRVVALVSTAPDAPLTKTCESPAVTEPIGMAATGKHLYVADAWGQALITFELDTLVLQAQTPLAKEPRAVLAMNGGEKVYVAHASGGHMSIVTPSTQEVTTVATFETVAQTAVAVKPQRDGTGAQLALDKRPRAAQGFTLASTKAIPGKVWAPQVAVDPGPIGERTAGYGANPNLPSHVPSAPVFDHGKQRFHTPSLPTRRPGDSLLMSRAVDRATTPCLLPRAAAVDGKTASLLVTCVGADTVIAYDALAANPVTAERNRWNVGAGPTGIALDEAARVAVVWSQFDRTLSVLNLDAGNGAVSAQDAPVERIAVKPLATPLPMEYALGRILFHAAGDVRVANDGRACASCHPDGRDDGNTWSTPDGPRRTILLAGRVANTAPYSWAGDEATLDGHLTHTFRRLGGRGLRNLELGALTGYLRALPAPKRPQLDDALVERGRQLFASEGTGCANCHSGAHYTDGKVHDVQSRHPVDRASGMHTPALTLVAGSAPYFHDGRYASLAELLRASDGTMGKTKHLGDQDLRALETFLKSL
jgi:DNA-binding beta-propeller fold protein YncE